MVQLLARTFGSIYPQVNFMRSSTPTQNEQLRRGEGGTAPSLRSHAPRVSERLAPVALPDFPQAWWKQHVFVLICIALFSVPAYLLASRFIVTAVVVQGRSMIPTLKDGERYYLNRWRYLFTKPQRGDVVVIKDPGHTDFAVKRIIGSPYDWVNLKDGSIYINGKRLSEPYLSKGVRTDTPDLKERWIQLGRDQYYLLGDNRSNSEDSRFYGVVARQNIIGMLIN